ncbi:CAP domain-containing protein [Brevundimonas sp. GCM10030266]|uniref:CAP domain-containing protein n=1 Tax=Brevundimonas sp. GCM10030266 TaxID=3273386 RepID=UPI003609CBB8
MPKTPTLIFAVAALSAGSACAAPYPSAGLAPDPVYVRQADPRARELAPIPAPQDSRPSDEVEARVLRAHNVERARVGAAPLIWEDGLEREARAWAEQLLATNSFAHDPSPHGHGENLWTGWGGRTWTPEEMVGEWIAEKAQYRHGVFPAVSRTGDWTVVGHYSQLVWSRTTHVGCALVRRGDRSVLACRYSPPGNIDGLRAY